MYEPKKLSEEQLRSAVGVDYYPLRPGRMRGSVERMHSNTTCSIRDAGEDRSIGTSFDGSDLSNRGASNSGASNSGTSFDRSDSGASNGARYDTLSGATEGNATFDASSLSSDLAFESLERNGASCSIGSAGHPDGCTPCAFYCYSLRGCRSGLKCIFCHLEHSNRGHRRRGKNNRRRAQVQAEPDDLEADALLAAERSPQRVASAFGYALPLFRGEVQIGVNKIADDTFESELGGSPKYVESSLTSPLPHSQQPIQVVPANMLIAAAQLQVLTAARLQAAQAAMQCSSSVGIPVAASSCDISDLVFDYSFDYSTCVAVLKLGQTVSLKPQLPLTGRRKIFAVSSELPRGLRLDELSGVIHGTPLELCIESRTYFITACDTSGLADIKTAAIRIRILPEYGPQDGVVTLKIPGMTVTIVPDTTAATDMYAYA